MVLPVRKDPVKLIYLLLGSLIINTGISFIWPLTTIYVTKYLHESLTVAGLVLFFNLTFSLLGNSIGGWLFDRWHPYQTIIFGITIATIATGLLVVWHGWPAYAILLMVLGFGDGIIVTCLNSTATLMKSKNPSYVFNVLYFMQNLGLVFGSLIVGFVLPLGITFLFALAFIMFIIFELLIIATFKGLNAAHENRHTQKANEKIKIPASNLKQIFSILICVFCVWIAYQQWASNISTYMLSMHLSIQSYSILWTLNAIIIVLFQPLLTFFDDFLTKHLHGRLYIGFILFAISFTLLLTAKNWFTFAASMTTLTIGEILSLPAVSTFVNDRAPEVLKGRFQGIVQSVTSAGRALGPLTGALIIDHASYFILFIFCIVIILLSELGFLLINSFTKKVN